MAFWAWVVGLSVVALMIYELFLWIKRKRNPQLEEPGAAEEAAEQAQAELTRANMKIAVLESRLEESDFAREEEKAELLEQQQKQLAQTEAAYQRQMVTLSERMAENGKGDWRVAVEKDKAEKNAEMYPVRMAAEVAAWKATVLGEETVADTAVSEDLALTTKDNTENIDEHDPAVNIPSEETADPNSETYPQMQETTGDGDDIAAAVAAISGLDPAEIGASYEEEYGPDVDVPGESWVLVEQNGGQQSSGSNGYAAVETDEDDLEEPVEVDLWQDDGEHEVMDQITVLDEAGADDLEETAVVEDYLLVVDNDVDAHEAEAEMVTPFEEEPVAVEEDELAAEIEPQPAQDLALLAGLAAAGDDVEDTIETLEHTDDLAVEVEIEAELEEEVVTALDDEIVTEIEDEVVTEIEDEVVTEINDEDVTALDDEDAAASEDEVVATVEDDGVFEVSEVGDETAVDVEESSEFENRWPDLEDQAKQRVLARRLSSEMDADYLEDEEYLREMGIQQNMPEQTLLSGEASEDTMGAENWVTDPLEEMANHINGEAQTVTEPAADEEHSSEEAVAPNVEVADNMWEEMVYASAEAERESNGSDGPAAAEAPDVDDVDDEDAVIAATVAAILSRAPEGQEPEEGDPDQTAAVQRPFGSDQNGSDRNGSAIFDGLATEAHADDDPLAGVPVDDAAFDGLAADVDTEVEVENEDAGEHSGDSNGNWERPSLDWQRQPVVWQAEYYANTGLADEPAVVRQDREIDFEWRDRAPAQGVEPRTFSVRWSSVLRLVEGQYRFTASAPDGMRLWLNDRLVISAWYDQSEQTYQRDFFWHGGPIDVRVEHYENGGNAKAFLTWDRVE